jgi:hypothetical protein
MATRVIGASHPGSPIIRVTAPQHPVTLSAVHPYPPQEPTPSSGPPYPGQPSGPPYPGMPQYGAPQPPPQFYGPSPYMPPPQPPRKPVSTPVILAIVFGVLAALCIGGGIISSVAEDADPDPVATATRAAAAEPTTTRVTPNTTPAVPTMVTVPNLVGKNAAVASDELKRIGFTNIKFGSVDQYDTVVILPENWKVAEQSHVPGLTIATDTLFVLGCTKQR